MRTTTFIRPLVAALALTLAGGAAMAQGSNSGDRQGLTGKRGDTRCDQMSAKKHARADMGMDFGLQHFSAKTLESLKLTDAQKLKYHDAQTAANAMHDANRTAMRQLRKDKPEVQPTYDPKAMFEQQNKRFEQFQQSRQTVQGQWLAFWDSLNADQQTVIQNEFKARFDKNKDRHQQRKGQRADVKQKS